MFALVVVVSCAAQAAGHAPPLLDHGPEFKKGLASQATTWHIVWVGGQSNSRGTNTQRQGEYPTWPTTERIRMYCSSGRGCTKGSFDPAKVPIHGEQNVGFSQTFANLLLRELPDDHGIVLLNTGVGGTGFVDGQWTVPDGPLTKNSIRAVDQLVADLPKNLGGDHVFHAMLWHQGEEDAGDNRAKFHAGYCSYLFEDVARLVDHLRASFQGASVATPFISGGLLPYWVDKEAGTADVMDAIYALNTSRPCTGTADSRIFSDYLPGTKIPNGDPRARSGASGDVIHFNATQAVLMGYQYFDAYKRALHLSVVSSSTRTSACGGSVPGPVAQCGASYQSIMLV